MVEYRKTVFVASCIYTDAISSDDSKERKMEQLWRCSWQLHNMQSASNRIWHLNVSRDLFTLTCGLRLSRSNLPISGLAYLD